MFATSNGSISTQHSPTISASAIITFDGMAYAASDRFWYWMISSAFSAAIKNGAMHSTIKRITSTIVAGLPHNNKKKKRVGEASVGHAIKMKWENWSQLSM